MADVRPRRRWLIAVALAMSLGAYGGWSSSRSGVFNNVVDERTSLRDHDVAWSTMFARPPTAVELLRIVRAHGGTCQAEPVTDVTKPTGRVFCQTETSGRLAAMMPTTIDWQMLLRRDGRGWRVVRRWRHEIAM